MNLLRKIRGEILFDSILILLEFQSNIKFKQIIFVKFFSSVRNLMIQFRMKIRIIYLFVTFAKKTISFSFSLKIVD